MTKDKRIGWIGLGKMGLPICKRLRDAGYEVTAFVRNDAGRAKAEAEGFAHVARIADLPRAADLIGAAISDDPALLDIVAGSDTLAESMTAGQTFVDMSTVSPEASARAAALLDAKGVAYLRAPVSGSTALAEAGTLTSMVSGPRRSFDDLADMFAAFTAKTFYVGDAEQARYLKLVINTLGGATSALLAEALALGRKGGLDTATALDVICQSAVASPLIGYKRATILEGKYDPAFSVTQIMKDFDIVLSVGRTIHAPLPLVSQIRQQYESAYLNGNGEKDFFVLVKEMADLATRSTPA